MTPDHFPAALRPHLQSILQGPPQTAPDRPIHSGQFWHLSPTLQQHPARTIYEILPDKGHQGHHYVRPWLPMNPHSHLNPVPGDMYSWTPVAPPSTSTNSHHICSSTIPPNTAWKKVLCQPNTYLDQTGKILRRVLSITSTDPPQVPNVQSTVQLPTKTLVELTQPPPATYTIYVDGGWDTVNADFTTTFQEQRDPTNRRGSAGIAIVPTGLDWMDKGTILITLSDGSQIGSQPAHMELAALIIGLALRRWQLPHQQGDIVYSDCKSITDVIKSTVPRLSKHPAKLPFLQAVLQHLTALRPQGTTIDWTESHLERRSTPDKYTINDWGILLADCAASNHPIPSNIRIQQHLQLSLPTLLQSSIDPATWFVSLPSGMPRMSSPIILKRDLTTFNYLANKRNLQGLSLHML